MIAARIEAEGRGDRRQEGKWKRVGRAPSERRKAEIDGEPRDGHDGDDNQGAWPCDDAGRHRHEFLQRPGLAVMGGVQFGDRRDRLLDMRRRVS